MGDEKARAPGDVPQIRHDTKPPSNNGSDKTADLLILLLPISKPDCRNGPRNINRIYMHAGSIPAVLKSGDFFCRNGITNRAKEEEKNKKAELERGSSEMPLP